MCPCGATGSAATARSPVAEPEPVSPQVLPLLLLLLVLLLVLLPAVRDGFAGFTTNDECFHALS